MMKHSMEQYQKLGMHQVMASLLSTANVEYLPLCTIKEIFARLIVVINLLLRSDINIILHFSFTSAVLQ